MFLVSVLSLFQADYGSLALKENLKYANEINIALFHIKDTFTSKVFTMTTQCIRNEGVNFCFC
jgi:hypothetical protein